MTAIRIIRPGLLTTVQDLGRWGFQSRGVPVAGAMDQYAHRWANALVGNAPGAATLEVTLEGPEIEFEDDRLVAVTGASFALEASGLPVAGRRVFAVRAGTRVSFGARLRGARAYVGIEGGIDVPPLLGSRSTHLLTRMGGFEGRRLQRGDRVPLGSRRARPTARRPLAEEGAGAPGPGPTRVRVLPGPHTEWFDDDALSLLQSGRYAIEPSSDRMAYRLAGPSIRTRRTEPMISSPTPMGAVQVLPTGLPLILMADRQTTGGYPQIAVVISADLGVAAQLAPGDAVSFAVCSAAEALAALVARERPLVDLEAGERA